MNADNDFTTDTALCSNLYLYCENNPVNRCDPTGRFWAEVWEVWQKGLTLAGGVAMLDSPAPGPADVVGAGIVVGSAVFAIIIVIVDPPQIPEQNIQDPLPIKPSTPARPDTSSNSEPKNGYYHVTSYESAMSIMASGVMYGSRWEAYEIYAWRRCPTRKALELCGARGTTTVIYFETTANFYDIKRSEINEKVHAFGPVKASPPSGMIYVENVRIVLQY